MIKFHLKKNDGSNFDLENYVRAGRLMLLFFRGAWCNHCKQQLKEIQNNLAKFDNKDIRIVALSCDSALNSSLLKEFLKLDFPVLSDAAFEVIDSFDLRTTYKGKDVSKPAIIIFDKNGLELFRYVGVDYDDRIKTDDLMQVITKIIK